MSEFLNYLFEVLRNPGPEFFLGAFIAFVTDGVYHFLVSLYTKYLTFPISHDVKGGDINDA